MLLHLHAAACCGVLHRAIFTSSHTVLCDYLSPAVVVNGTGRLEECVAQVSGIIDAEKAKTCHRMAPRSIES